MANKNILTFFSITFFVILITFYQNRQASNLIDEINSTPGVHWKAG